MAIGVRRFNERSFIELVPLALLRELLRRAPWHDKLPASIDVDSLTSEQLFTFLVDGAPDGGPPPDLVEALHCMNDVLTQDCELRIIDLAKDAGVLDLLRDESGHVPAVHELVVRAYLFARETVFDRVWDEEFLHSLSFPYDRLALQCPIVDVTDELVDAFRDALRPLLIAQDQGNYCTVKYYFEAHGDDVDEDGEATRRRLDHYFIIRHGWRPVRETVVDGDREGVVAFRPARQSVIHYNEETGKLRLHAATRKLEEREALRDLFAARILGDESLFRHEEAAQLYTLAPIRRDGTDFRFEAGLGPLDLVKVSEIKVARGAGSRRVVNVVANKEDALAEIESGYDKIDLHTDDLVHAKLSFRLQTAGGLVRRTVLIRPPSVCSFKESSHAETIWGLLERNGFLVRKPAA
jgi:hypothetical protein